LKSERANTFLRLNMITLGALFLMYLASECSIVLLKDSLPGLRGMITAF
jgi:hypothetical protein